MQNTPETAAQKEQFIRQMLKDSAPYPAAGMHYLHDVIDPRKTRDYLIRALEISWDRRTGGVGQHRLANWPTKF
jgi:acetyl-CoA carboxylase carboxyltransferase component